MARDMGVELAELEGSGPGGRIVKADVEAAAEGGSKTRERKPEEEEREREPAQAKGSEDGAGDGRVKASPVARRMARDMGVELAERLTDRIDRIRELLAVEPSEAVDRFVLRMPRGYFLSVDPATAARHFSTVSPPLGTKEVRTAVGEGARPGSYELLVVAADRPGLLSQIAGALSLAGLSILTAQAFTTDDGAAVDLFEVEGAFEREISEERWRAFRSTLRRSIDGAISLERRVEDKRGHYPPPRLIAPMTVSIDNQASDFSTVIEVGAPDRIGLLYDITRALAELKLDVHLAKVTTYTDRVVDAFYVRDALGRKVTDPGQVREVEEVLRRHVGAPDA